MFGLLSLSYINSAWAADLYPKVYDATYETKTAQGNMQMHMLSNGKGLTRTETAMPGGMKMVTIIDMPGHSAQSIMEAQKMIMKAPYKGDKGKAIDTDEAKKLNATDLGSKLVNGHMCQGWSYKTAQTSTEVWVDKDAGVSVKSITTSEKTTTEMNLKTLSTNMPADSNFKVPASGYKVLATP